MKSLEAAEALGRRAFAWLADLGFEGPEVQGTERELSLRWSHASTRKLTVYFEAFGQPWVQVHHPSRAQAYGVNEVISVLEPALVVPEATEARIAAWSAFLQRHQARALGDDDTLLDAILHDREQR